ncbi:hypothetical protein ACFVVQ_07430 [Paenibacillus chitinolyticus]|uniref:hypothetical protein n=1 Tax=Paenibacillus chitinolyticus TaxID=79263 RepID=UPI0036D8B71C
MVKRELSMLFFIFRTQTILICLPFLVYTIACLGNYYGYFNGLEFMVFVGFWIHVFPAVAITYQVGSLRQQELFISLPLSSVRYGLIYPCLLSVLYGFFYETALLICINSNNGFAKSADMAVNSFPSFLLVFFLTVTLVSLFKNSAIGLCLTLFYVFFGLFTGGAGQGPFYLMQWYRPKINTDVNDFVIVQYAAVIVLCVLHILFIKYRHRFYLLKIT